MLWFFNASAPPVAPVTPNVSTGNTEVTATSSVSGVTDFMGPILDKDTDVSETCLKEVMACELSPLGFHLASNIKDKIWKHEFIDMLSLLTINKDIKSDKKYKDKDDERKHLAPKSFHNWLQAFCI